LIPGGETLYVTDHGKPVLKIEPLADRRSIFDVFKEFSNSVEIPEEALTPEPDEWGDSHCYQRQSDQGLLFQDRLVRGCGGIV